MVLRSSRFAKIAAWCVAVSGSSRVARVGQSHRIPAGVAYCRRFRHVAEALSSAQPRRSFRSTAAWLIRTSLVAVSKVSRSRAAIARR